MPCVSEWLSVKLESFCGNIYLSQERLPEQTIRTWRDKVKFNICNVHYAPITVAEEGTVTFGTPVPMPGAVSISMDPTGEPESFYADGIEYYVINNTRDMTVTWNLQ